MTPSAGTVKPSVVNDSGLRPVPAAPHNVFVNSREALTSGAHKAWTNRYELPIEYTVEMHDDLLSPANPTLATRFMPPALKRRFCVVDDAVQRLYGARLEAYFLYHGVRLRVVVVDGGEENKRFAAVESICNALCEFGLLRREPIIAIGGGCVLDTVGFAASAYRRGVPYVRVPTTLLALVDASVGAKCGVDWVHPSLGSLKNRIGAFYPPTAALLDKHFVASQDRRNIVNGLGEIMKLALVRSDELFSLLEEHGARVISQRFQGADPAADRIIELSIQIMLEELGPNLWEHQLERCVDYGHTFSKILEMVAPVLHGEAVNVDGLFCVALALQRGWITRPLAQRIAVTMVALGLPLWHPACTRDALWQGVQDGIEHRHGKLRMPLIKDRIGNYGFVNEITREEIAAGIETAQDLVRLCQKPPAAQHNDVC
eukprot:IDg10896t1